MENLEHVCFRDVSWLQINGGLRAEMVLEYFSLSQFYDRTCNNEVLKMQARFTGGIFSIDQLKEMRGFEYDLINEACKAPQLFLVGYYERHSSTRRDLKRAFYILDGTIYVAPSLYNVLSSRITSSIGHMQLAVSYARDHLYFDAGTCVYRQSGDKSNVPDTDLDDHEGSDLHCGREARRYVWRDEEEMLEKILSEITHKT